MRHFFEVCDGVLIQNIENSQRYSQKCQNNFVNNTAKHSSRIVRALIPQLTPFQNILEMDLPIAIFSEKTADWIILHLYHDSKAKRHNISQFGIYSMLISWFAHHTWDQKCGNENLHFAIEEEIKVGHWSQRKHFLFEAK